MISQEQIQQFVETFGNRFVTDKGLNVLELPWRDNLSHQRVVFSWKSGKTVWITYVQGIGSRTTICGEVNFAYTDDETLLMLAEYWGNQFGWQ